MRTCLVRAGNRHSLKTHSHWAGDEQEREMPGKVVGGGGAKRELWSLVENAGRIFLRTDVV